MTTIVCAPHPDDEMIGMGGTIAKLAKAGERVVVVIFTLGEGSHPWQRIEAIQETRRKEALEASQVAGVSETVFLELEDLNIAKQVVETDAQRHMIALLEKEKPDQVFMPALDDVHSDHRSTARFVLDTLEVMKLDVPVWMYTVWNPLFVINRDQPRRIVNITKTFPKKWKAINRYKSQKVSTFQLIPTVLLRGLLHGIKHGVPMAEVFLKAPRKQ